MSNIYDIYPKLVERFCEEDIVWLRDKLNQEYPNSCSGNGKGVKKVIFNPPATIILWNDGTKSVVKCQNGEEYVSEKGFVMAYLKKMLGNDNTFNKEIRKWVQDEAD